MFLNNIFELCEFTLNPALAKRMSILPFSRLIRLIEAIEVGKA